MDSALTSDIFFFVTTIAIVLLTIGGIIVIVYLVKIVRNVKDISEKFREQTKSISHDIDEMRQSGVGGIWKGLLALKNFFKKSKKHHHEKKHK